jgi:CO dehydrogenase maturation factor
MIVAVSGKGGVGKTVLASLLVGRLSSEKELLAIDADPDSNLPDVLGVQVEQTLGDIREELLEERDSLPPEVSWMGLLEGKVQAAMEETDTYDLLSMGRPEGQGCYCAVNNVLRGIIDKLEQDYEMVVIDAEAGLEHLSRRTTQDVDIMLVVTDSSKRGVETARRIKELAEDLKISFKRIGIVLNRATAATTERLLSLAEGMGLEVVGVIPEDEEIRMRDNEGRPLTNLPEDSPVLEAVDKLIEELGLRN